MKILVTGATGHLGKATLEFLLEKLPATQVAALARSAEKAAELTAKNVDVRIGDYTDYTSLVNAFQGIDKLFLVSSNDLANRTAQQLAAVKAAKEAGVKHIVYTSIPHKTPGGAAPLAFVVGSHVETENAIKESGIAYTILRNNLYMDLLPVFVGEQVAQTGVVYFPAGDGKTAFATRKDFAEASANLLIDSTAHENKTYEFASPVSYSFYDVASALSEVLGKEIVYAKPTVEEYKTTLTNAGVPAEGVGFFAAFAENIALGELDIPDNTVEKLLGRKPTGMSEFLRSIYRN